MAMNLQLRKFDMAKIKPWNTIVLIGKRYTGKSFLTRDILFHMKHIPLGTVISATEDVNPFYADMIPSLCIHGEYKPEIVAKTIERQRGVVMKMNEEIKAKGGSEIDPHAFLILDDCLFDSSWTKNTLIRYLFMNGRHLKILFLITMQYAVGIPPALRTNVDFVFIFRENIMRNRKNLYECYAGMFPSFEAFCMVMDQCTENFECMVIVNNAQSNKLEDQVFWYKATSHGSFRTCAPSIWELSERHRAAAAAGGGDEGAFDSSGFRKRSGPTISVKKTG